MNTNSVAFNNQGGTDWLVAALDMKGRNQCTTLNIKNVTSSLFFKDSTAKFRLETSAVSFKDITSPSSS